jgi:GT2 family glycosyltransferase
MQLKLYTSIEWIIVCDDPSLHSDVLAQLQSRRKLLRGRTILLCNSDSYGCGRVNMIGAKVAQGRMLLFMAADIWIDDFSVFKKGFAAIDSGAYGAVGFRLLHEDGTILHDGLRFEKSSELHDLFLLDHPGQGLPPKDYDDKIVSVPAVTSALLLISKKIFDDVGGFDNIYLVHEYEDVDLCMKVNQIARKEIGLIRERGCYRLFQKEVSVIGEMSLAGIIVYLNCLSFNRKWGSKIGREINNSEWF